MQVNRRSAIKQLLIISAGAALLPACVNDKKPAAAAYNNLGITVADEELLAAIAGTLIPTTDTPGARDVGAHAFALRMLNDCYKKEDRERFVAGLQQFRDGVRKKYSKSYAQCTAPEQEAIIAAAAARQDAGNDAAYFYNTFKRLTIQGYTSSEYYLTKVEVYKLVPGKYISSVPV